MVEALQGRPFALRNCAATVEEQLRQMVKRATCPYWWMRQLKREATHRFEGAAVRAGRVGKGTGQDYCTDETLHRRQLDTDRNAAILAATEIESADGDVITLKEAVDASPAAKPIRRGELMTRIRGCEEWAEAAGMVGLFTTNTAPSRFHSQGGRNPRYDGSTPKEAHQWLCSTWGDTRSKLRRDKIKFFGFRVAEPHRDGCAHWHMLLWMRPEDIKRFKAIMHKWWRREAGDEKGAAKHRVTIKDMRKGGASGYVAKYIAKNIDDFGTVGDEGHRDAMPGDDELFGGTARRVEAWATAWGIRQFQPFGQPPVTEWRELRRVDASAAQGASSDNLRRAAAAVNRDGDRRADWCEYMSAQGGAMSGRRRNVRIKAEAAEVEGRYGKAEVQRPIGVYALDCPGEVLPSNRKQWKPRGAWTEPQRDEARRGLMGWARDEYLGLWARSAQPAAQPWTRVNNCARRSPPACYVAGRLVPRGAPLMTWSQAISTQNRGGEGASGSFNDPPKELSPWTGPPTPPMTRSTH